MRVFMFFIHVHAEVIFRVLGVVWVGCVFLCLSHMSMLQEFSGSRVWYGGMRGMRVFIFVIYVHGGRIFKL